MSTAGPRDIIAPCPFCGGTANVYTYECQDPFVGCNGGRGDVVCDANGPSMPTEAEAIARWNRRTPAAGYRVVREGDLDAATVERCIAEIDCGCEPDHCPVPGFCAKEDVATLRALAGEAK